MNADPETRNLWLPAAATWFAFASHNVEEILRFRAWDGIAFTPMVGNETTFLLAVSLLTLLLGAVFFHAASFGFSSLAGSLAAIFSMGLAVNAAGHVVLSLIYGFLVPGALTGVFLLLPASLWLVRAIGHAAGYDLRRYLVCVLLGAATVPMAAASSLSFAEILLAAGG